MNNRDSVKRIINIGAFIFVVSIVFIYTFFSFRDYINGPEIIITYPTNGSTISTSTVTVIGQVLHIQDITFNNKPLTIDKAGNFEHTILLSPGYNISLLSAKDRFDRIIEYKLELVYKK